jgi:hypothetical protein
MLRDAGVPLTPLFAGVTEIDQVPFVSFARDVHVIFVFDFLQVRVTDFLPLRALAL